MPWIEKVWDTPNVAHDNPSDQRLHASLMLGFADTDALRSFFGSEEIATLSGIGQAANERDQGRCIERETRSRRSSDDHRV